MSAASNGVFEQVSAVTGLHARLHAGETLLDEHGQAVICDDLPIFIAPRRTYLGRWSDRNEDSIVNLLRTHGRMSRNRLTRSTQRMRERERAAALQRLVGRGDCIEEIVHGVSRPRREYELRFVPERSVREASL